MALKFSEAPKAQRSAVVGAFIGMGVAAFVAFNYAYDSATIVRYLIMCAGLLGGGGAGFGLATLMAKR